MSIGGREYLFYKAFKRLDVALLRGTTADPNGNITMEREALFLESLAVATAVHNGGGLVIVQVERIAEAGSLHPKDVKIPGVLVDCVVVSTPEHHPQTWGTQYSAAMSGELRVPLSSVPPLLMISLPPLEIIVPLATPALSTTCEPANTVVALAMPSTSCTPPEMRAPTASPPN